MACLAQADKLPCVPVPYGQGQLRPVAQVLDMMHHHSPAVPAPRFAHLTLIVVEREHAAAQALPLRPMVKGVGIARRNELGKPGKLLLRHCPAMSSRALQHGHMRIVCGNFVPL